MNRVYLFSNTSDGWFLLLYSDGTARYVSEGYLKTLRDILTYDNPSGLWNYKYQRDIENDEDSFRNLKYLGRLTKELIDDLELIQELKK